MESELLLYLLKVNLSLMIFTCIYSLLFQHDTFFVLKRYYFLIVILFSFFYPVITIHSFPASNTPVLPFFSLEEIMGINSETVNESSLSSWSIIVLVACSISSYFLFRLLMQCISLIRHRQQAHKKKLPDGTIVLLTNSNISPFSFFHWIFMNEENCNSDASGNIIAHEKVHVRQFHSIDVLLVEFVCAICWFNPFIWIFRKNMKVNLEYIADAEALSMQKTDTKNYQYHLLKMTNKKAAAIITNNFNFSQLKKRIMMMNKEKTKKRKQLLYLLMLPVASLFFLANSMESFSQQGNKSTADDSEVYMEVDKPPVFPDGAEKLMQYLTENLKYPSDTESLEDVRVVVKFVVDKTGKVKNPEILTEPAPAFDKEAIRLISSMPTWIPGEKSGEKVDVYYAIPILFKKQ